jgi:hypothetical protein
MYRQTQKQRSEEIEAEMSEEAHLFPKEQQLEEDYVAILMLMIGLACLEQEVDRNGMVSESSS